MHIPWKQHRPLLTRGDPLNLVVEIKGYRGEDAKEKANAMRAYWAPGVNNLGKFGRWDFAEFTEVYEIDAEFDELIKRQSARLLAKLGGSEPQLQHIPRRRGTMQR